MSPSTVDKGPELSAIHVRIYVPRASVMIDVRSGGLVRIRLSSPYQETVDVSVDVSKTEALEAAAEA